MTNYLHNTFSDNYEPTVLDVYNGKKMIDNVQVDLELHDTSGERGLVGNRKVIYQGADVFMLCIAIDKKDSFDNIDFWVDEIRSEASQVPIYLILTKSDMDDG